VSRPADDQTARVLKARQLRANAKKSPDAAIDSTSRRSGRSSFTTPKKSIASATPTHVATSHRRGAGRSKKRCTPTTKLASPRTCKALLATITTGANPGRARRKFSANPTARSALPNVHQPGPG
jgi:hypothetical protein